MLFALQLLAQAADGGQAQPSPTGGLWSFAPLIIIFILFYFFMIRAPMKRQEQERKNLYSALKKNDKVVTSGGIIGVVANIKDKEDEVTLKIDDNSNVRLKVTRSSIVRIVTPEEAAKEQKDGAS